MQHSMSKRFTETGKWKDAWFRRLKPIQKLFYLMLLDECDAAGFWEPDEELASFMLGASIDLPSLLNAFDGRVEVLPSGYWRITKFVDFQYGKLSDANPCHRGVLKLINQRTLQGPSKGLQSPIGIGIGKGEGKEKGEGGVGETVSTIKFSTVIPAALDSENFRAAWSLWLAHLKAKKKPPTIHAQDLQLGKLAKMGIPKAIETLHRCIEKNWQGIYEQNENTQSTPQSSPTPKTKEQLDREMLLEAMR